MVGRALLILLAAVAAGCDFAVTPVAPSPVTHGDFEWDINPPPTVDRPFIVGCTNVLVGECDAIVGAILEAVPATRTPTTLVEIELHCEAVPHESPDEGHTSPDDCAPSLDARVGTATIEFGDGVEPLQFSVAGSPTSPTVDALRLGDCPPFCWELSTPASPRVTGSGPFTFQVGHCGLNHFIDFDGGFWVVAGFVSGDVGNAGFGGPGTIHVVAADMAFYRHEGAAGEGAFFARLVRYPGPKFIWQWCA